MFFHFSIFSALFFLNDTSYTFVKPVGKVHVTMP